MNKTFGVIGQTLFFIAFAFAVVMANTYFEKLQPGQKINGFSVKNLYVNSADKAMGARFISDKYGFIVDLMQIQSVPQGFFWIKTLPTSDKGEAHTCEHLLLGKGNRGRFVATLENMALGNSTAYTAQVKTCYSFNTIAGGETFYKILQAKLEAFLHPDFTDEEIRREVCHIGVNKDQQTSKLSLEEKGTVYTEMVSSFEKPWYYYYDAMSHMLYGDNHPLVNNSGGKPEALRTLTPQDLWKFHSDYYRLSNMGIIVSIPDDIAIDSFLEKMAKILDDCKEMPGLSKYVGMSEYPLPDPKPGPFGAVKMVKYPSDNKEDPGEMHFCWPPDLDPDNKQSMMIDLFLSAFSDGTTSNLYDIFINSKTRRINLGGNSVSSWNPNYQGHPIWISLEGLDNSNITKPMIDTVRTIIIDELKQIYGFGDNSPELKEFNDRVKGRLVQQRKQMEDYLNSPPMFGFRGGSGGGWVSNFETLEKDSDFRKSLVMKKDFAYAESLLATNTNIWKSLIDYCHFLKITPYAVGSTPDPGMVTQMKESKEARLASYAADFEKKYGTKDDQKAIEKYKEEFDKKTDELDKIAAGQKLPGFIDNPPMTLDDQIKYETIKLNNNVPLVASSFENMNSATIGIELRLDVVPESLLVYLPLLPDILTSIGVIEDGKIIPYEEMRKRLQNEVLRLDSDFDFGFQTGRIEIALSGSGSNLEELKNAIHWMKLSLYSPYLNSDNLPRITDIIDQTLISLRNTIKAPEEYWVNYAALAYRFQSNPLFLSTNTFMTKVHHLQRLRFMLTDPGTPDQQKEIAGLIDFLAEFGQNKDRNDLANLLDSLESNSATIESRPRLSGMTPLSQANAQLIIKSLKSDLADIPDANLNGDWMFLCNEIKADLMVKPEAALNDIRLALTMLCKSDNARMYMISNSDDRKATIGLINDFASMLDSKNTSFRQKYSDSNRIIQRLKNREPNADKPIYVGLINEGTRNGVLMNSASYAGEFDTTTNSVLNCLAGKLFSGGGPHGLFMRTWGAGLAYSNGVSVNEITGRVAYYAERCPDVSETMRFVVNELKNAKDDPSLTDYAIALIFDRSRAASRYEERGQSIAADLADGYTPDRVFAFRAKVLAVRHNKDLYPEIKKRMQDIYGRVITGYGKPLSQSPDGCFFLVGPETQFQSYEKYIESAEGKQTIYRLYPRDFWITMHIQYIK